LARLRSPFRKALLALRPGPGGFRSRIAAERGRIHARMMLAAAPAQIGFWLLLVLVFLETAPRAGLVAIFCTLSMLTGGLALLARRLAAIEPDDPGLGRTQLAVTVFAILAALVAGLLAAWQFPALPDTTQLLLTTTLIAAYAIAIAAHHASSFVLLGVGLGMLGPLAIAWMALGSLQDLTIGLALLGLVLLSWYIGIIAGAAIDEAIRARLRVAELSDRLESRGRDLEAAVRAKTQFLAAASHDLRQPVTSLNLVLSAVEQQAAAGNTAAAGDPAQGEGASAAALGSLAARMRPAVNAMGNILDSMLEMSRLEAGLVRITIVPIDLRDLLLSIQIEFTPRAQSRQLQLTTDVAAINIESDRDLLGRIVRNLVDNALKYTPAGSVAIGARMDGDSCVITIEDTGIGIAPDNLDRVFDDYYQAGNPNRDRGMGFGLGLSIVKRLVGLLGGTIGVTSELGKGSRFELRFPTVAVAVATPLEPAVRLSLAQALAGKSRLLVVDDDVLVRDALMLVLESVPIELRFAANPREGIALVATAAYAADVAIVDYRLPGGMNGLDVLASLLGRNPSLAAVVISGDLDSGLPGRAADLHAALVSKPFSADELAAGIAAARQLAGARTAATSRPRAKAPPPGEP
jgi:signal transduction histidine kinase/ActR/RegA family two-component response regulator